jgi:hypothetical protein
MSQHLIETGRHDTALPDDAHTSEARSNGASGRERPSEANGVTAHNGSGDASGSQAERGDDSATRSSGDSTLRALEALSSALAEMGKDQRLLEERLKDLHRQRSKGRAWHEILDEEDPPGTMQLVSRVLACLAKASGTLRKELVDSLRREGVSIPAIARLFGVTHQRVSNLLRRPAEPDNEAG